MSLKKVLDDLCDQAGDDGVVIILNLSQSGPIQGPIRYAKDKEGNRIDNVYQMLVQAQLGKQPQLVDFLFEASSVLSIMAPRGPSEQPRIVTPGGGIHIPS